MTQNTRAFFQFLEYEDGIVRQMKRMKGRRGTLVGLCAGFRPY